MRPSFLLVLPLIAAGCLSIGPAPARGLLAVEQQVWWDRMRDLCGRAYPGRLVEQGSADQRYAGRLTARFARCAADTVEVAFDVGSERTRLWRLVRSDRGLRLTHLHTGADDPPSGYGGVTRDQGSARQQDFVVDSFTVRMLPAAAGNVWSLEVRPRRMLAYTLRRPGVRGRFRVEFDLSRPRGRETDRLSPP